MLTQIHDKDQANTNIQENTDHHKDGGQENPNGGLVLTNRDTVEYDGLIKLHHTTSDLLKSVINTLKKSAIKEWATSCDTVFSNNQALNKRRLCDLLDSCTREKM